MSSFYQGGTDATAKSYGEIFDENFHVTAPRYLPWGGTSNLGEYLSNVLPQVTAVLDFTRCKIISLIGEDSSIVILVDIGLKGSADSVSISEHWEIYQGKAISLWVAYFDPSGLMELLQDNGTRS